MNIKSAAERSGLPAKTIRYYEEIGLVRPERSANGYRDYGAEDVHRLRFVQRSRSLGFAIEECRQLLSLYDDKSRASAEVKAIATEKLAEIDRKIAELTGLRQTLSHLVAHCHGDERPDCPIIEELAGERPAGPITLPRATVPPPASAAFQECAPTPAVRTGTARPRSV